MAAQNNKDGIVVTQYSEDLITNSKLAKLVDDNWFKYPNLNFKGLHTCLRNKYRLFAFLIYPIVIMFLFSATYIMLFAILFSIKTRNQVVEVEFISILFVSMQTIWLFFVFGPSLLSQQHKRMHHFTLTKLADIKENYMKITEENFWIARSKNTKAIERGDAGVVGVVATKLMTPGEKVGFGLKQMGSIIYFDIFAVKEEFRRKSVGRKMFQEAMKYYKDQKINHFVVFVDEFSTPAIKFFRKMGFSVMKSIPRIPIINASLTIMIMDVK